MQEVLVDLRSKDEIPDILLMLEHSPVITLGLRSRPEEVLVSEVELKKLNIAMFKTVRGGSVTYHGPGQIVIYPILKLGGTEADAHSYLANLEEVAIRTCAYFGVDAFRKKGKTGAWTSQGKIAAIGVRFKRWITFHGMSFNVAPNMKHFQLIIPCGLIGERVISLKEILNEKKPTIEEVKANMLKNFSTVFKRNFISSQNNNKLVELINEQKWSLA